MTKTFAITLVAGFFATLATNAQAEDRYHGSYNYDGRWQASTVGESWSRGRAAVIEATGRYNRDTSEANINNQEAYSMALDNHLKKIDTYYASREKSRAYRAAERGERPSTEAVYRYSRNRTPERASSYQVEPVFGTIAWPTVFESDRFDTQRAQLDELFRDRDTQRLATRDIQQQTSDMQDELKSLISELSPSEYVQAKNFLKTLAYEARFAPQTAGLASR